MSATGLMAVSWREVFTGLEKEWAAEYGIDTNRHGSTVRPQMRSSQARL
jgi:hypothetical protein